MIIEDIDYALIGGEEYNPYNRTYRLIRDYKFFFRTHEITIPAGYKWDGPTGVPYVGTLNRGWLEPSLVHDYLYEEQGRIEGVALTRAEVDEKFFTDLRANHVSVIYIWIMKLFLDGVFQDVWDDTSEGASHVLKKYMAPVSMIAFAIGAAVTSGVLFYAPTILGFIAALI